MKITCQKKLPGSIESSKFVLLKEWQEKFYSRKDSHLTKFEWMPQILVKLRFWELCDSKLSGLHYFDNTAIIHWVKNGSKTER